MGACRKAESGFSVAGRLAGDPVSVAIHRLAIAGLTRIERRLAGRTDLIASGVAYALLDARAFLRRLHDGRWKGPPDIPADAAEHHGRYEDFLRAHGAALARSRLWKRKAAAVPNDDQFIARSMKARQGGRGVQVRCTEQRNALLFHVKF